MILIARIWLVVLLVVGGWLASALAATPDSAPAKTAQLAAWRKTLLDAAQPMTDREDALAQLAASKDGGLMLLNLASQQKFPADLAEVAGESLGRNPDFNVRALATQYFPRPSRSGKPYPPLAELAKLRGDVPRGHAVFLSTLAGCATCHRFGSEGRDIGPDLSQIRTKYDRAALIDSILNPNAAITAGFEPWMITTKDDDTRTGFILVNGEEVVLKEISGETRSIPAKDIARRQQLLLSVMPDNVSLGLTPQELADVVEFLCQPQLSPAGEKAKPVP